MVLQSKRIEAYATNIVLSMTAIVQSKDRKVLLIWEGDLPYHNLWVIPMGYVRQNERVVDAVSREVREETGIAVKVEDLVGVYDDFIEMNGHRLHHVITCYRTKALTDPPKVSREAKEHAWINRKQVTGLTAPDVVKTMLFEHFKL
jgi:ADP-ribose pyrophosphatase YjhB (NUDIX family)